MVYIRNILIIFIMFFVGVYHSIGQVRIGDSTNPNTEAILDLTNSENLGLALHIQQSDPINNPKPIGMLYYYNDYLYISQDSVVASWNVLSPWVYKGKQHLNKGVSYPYTPGLAIGVEFGLSQNNSLHIANRPISRNSISKTSSLLIGDAKDSTTNLNYHYLMMDSDDILVRKNSGEAGILKLQEMVNSNVQVGSPIDSSGNVNVFGKVQENGGDIMPAGTVIMYYDNLASFTNGLGTGEMTGWGLCDGSSYTFNGTTITSPDLRGRFIVGAGTPIAGNTTYYKDSIGGYDQVIQRKEEVFAHNHAPGMTLITNTKGEHYHKHPYTNDTGANVGDIGSVGCCGCEGIGPEGSFNRTSTNDGEHGHSVYGSTSNVNSGSQTAMDKIPPYFVVYYLVKL